MSCATNNPRLAKIEALIPTLATKEDLHREIHAQTWRLVSFVTLIGGALTAAVYFIATHAKGVA